jgi:hypothetical protein
MDLSIKFPSDGDVIREEVARFRSLSPEERIAYIRGMITAGAVMIRLSPKAEFLQQCALEEKELARQAVKDFIARHIGSSAPPRDRHE